MGSLHYSIYSELNEFDRIKNPDTIIERFKKFCTNYLQEKNELKQLETIQSLFNLFRESNSEFYEKISTNNFSPYPIFTPEILQSFLDSFEKMNNKELSDFFDFLYERYSGKRIIDIERDFLKKFSEILENNIAKENRKIRRWHLVHLKSFIDKRLHEEIQ